MVGAFQSTNPPPYEELLMEKEAAAPSKWNPLHWPTWAKLWGGLAIVCIIVGVAVGAYFGVKENKYPNYSKLTYTLVDRYHGVDFFDNFDYYDTTDPSDGYVVYVDNSTASSLNLTYATSSRAVLRVDNSDSSSSTTTSTATSTTNTGSAMGGGGMGGFSGNSFSSNSLSSRQASTSSTSSTGRNSVRITSKNQYDSGLFVFDIIHTPYGCGTWPALWLSDPSNWPAHGEIDVMEAVEQGNIGNQMTLHTSEGCKMNGIKRKETGTVLETNCYEGADDNDGCGVRGAKATYGEAFNNNGGGIYAMELRDAGIRIWMFARDSIPDDLDSDNDDSPDPSGWGEALADFPNTDCDISSHFKNQSIIANIDLCGDWAGLTSVYTTEYGCPDTCEDYVSTNATAFDTAYWEFASFRVYSSS